MSGYVDEGFLKFNINIPADVSFKIGITDNFTNEQWIEFPAGETIYDLERNGEWRQVKIPLIDFSGIIAFQNMNYMFAISSIDGDLPISTFQLGIDNIVWEDGNGVTSEIPVTGVNTSITNSTLEIGETAQITASISPNTASNQSINWSSNDTSIVTVNTNGLVTAIANGTTTITALTTDGNFTANNTITVNSTTSTTSFIPNPNKTYYIDSPVHNLRIASSGESEDPYTTTTTTTGNDVEWSFVEKGNGSWHIQRAAGGTLPRLRTDNSENTDMAATTSNGVYTYFDFDKGFTDGTYFITLPDGPTNYNRLQIDNSGLVKMVSTTSNRTWESFSFTEATTNPTQTLTSILIEAEDYVTMNGIALEDTIDENGGQNVGYINTGDWMEYLITIPTAGSYTVSYRVASVPGQGIVEFQVDGNTLATTNIEATTDWQDWTTITDTVTLSAGTQKIRLYAANSDWNINWFKLENKNTNAKNTIKSNIQISDIKLFPVPATDNLNISISDFENYSKVDIIDLNGRVITNVLIKNKVTNFNINNFSNGLYLIRIYKDGKLSKVLKFVK